MGEAAAFVVVFFGQAEPALAEAGGDHDRAAGMALALGGLDRPGTAAGKAHDLAEADLDAGRGRIVGELRRDLRAVAGALEVVQLAEIDQRAARRQLVEAEGLQAGAGGFGGGGETGRAGADDDDVEGRCVHRRTNRFSALKFKWLDSVTPYT